MVRVLKMRDYRYTFPCRLTTVQVVAIAVCKKIAVIFISILPYPMLSRTCLELDVSVS